jgi:hypothetical protein
VTTALAVGLGVVFTAIFFTDTLCPEHRAWVQALAAVALTGTVVAAVGLVKQWAIAPILALMVTLCGTAIGVLDAVHSASRGRAIAAAFSLLAFGAMVVVFRQMTLMRWDRVVRRSLTADTDTATTTEPATTAEADSQPQPETAPVEDPSATADLPG